MTPVVRAAILLCAVFTLTAANDAPVIGILTQPYYGPNSSKTVRHLQARYLFVSSDTLVTQSTYIAASYVKYIESAGGRVVPVHFSQPLDNLGQNLTETFFLCIS
jgi:hypothetical protein